MNKILVVIFVLIPLMSNAQYENENSITIDDIEYYMATDEECYAPGDSVHMIYRITNYSNSAIIFQFNSAQRYDFIVNQEENIIWYWSCMMGFVEWVWFLTLNPGNSTEANHYWGIVDNWGNQISSGIYEVTGLYTYVNYNTVPVSVNIEYLLSDANDESLFSPKIKLFNFPNPFNPETKIEYYITQETDVVLKIYNIKGQKVKTLVNEVLTAGEYSIIWDGRDYNQQTVSSGIYLYKLKVNSKREAVKKCLLLK